jgi:hypothetical protein
LVAFQVELCGGEPGARRGIDRERERDGESEGFLDSASSLMHRDGYDHQPPFSLFPRSCKRMKQKLLIDIHE